MDLGLLHKNLLGFTVAHLDDVHALLQAVVLTACHVIIADGNGILIEEKLFHATLYIREVKLLSIGDVHIREAEAGIAQRTADEGHDAQMGKVLDLLGELYFKLVTVLIDTRLVQGYTQH